MFANIHFQKINPEEILADDYIPEYWYSSEDQKPDDFSMYTAAIDADYSISGSVFLLPLRPVSLYAKEHYLYLQCFGLLQSDENYYTKRKNYNSYLILFTYSGAGYLEYEGREYYLKEGEGFFIDCHKPHFYRSDSRLWYHSDLHFNGPLADDFFQLFKNGGSVIFSSSVGGSYQNHLENLLNIYNTAPHYMELQISNELHQILTVIIVKTEKTTAKTVATTDTMRYLMEYIESNYNTRLSLDDMAKRANISKYHLCREFKKYTGFSPNEYLIRLRIERAKLLLHNTNIPVGKIAHLVGIPDENNFTYLFKKHEGTTPGRFRTV